jgi:hypothetical protein
MNEKTGETRLDDGDLFIVFGKQKNGNRGLGFYVSATWVSRIASYKLVNE